MIGNKENKIYIDDPLQIARVCFDNMTFDLDSLRPIDAKLVNDIEAATALYIIEQDILDLTDKRQAYIAREYIKIAIFNAGRIQGIREERARRKDKKDE